MTFLAVDAKVNKAFFRGVDPSRQRDGATERKDLRHVGQALDWEGEKAEIPKGGYTSILAWARVRGWESWTGGSRRVE